MKRILVVGLLPFLFIACAKEEMTNETFRTPTCADTTDEGIFEKFTTPEAGEFLKFYTSVPDVEDTTAIAFKRISSRELFNQSNIYDPIFVFKRKRPAEFFMYMPLKAEQQEYYSWTSESTDTSRIDTVNLYNVRHLFLQPGCYRLYYIFSDTSLIDTVRGKVFTKGHYDIEIK